MKKYHVYQKSLGNDLKWISRKYMVSMLDLCEWNKLPVETPDQVSVVSVCVYAVCVCVCVCSRAYPVIAPHNNFWYHYIRRIP